MSAATLPLRLGGLSVLLLVALGTSVLVGAAALPTREVLAGLSGSGDPLTRTILMELRLPRAILAALVGGGLGICGAVFQAILRNPLAEPYVLGVSGGAAVGAVGAVVLGWSVRWEWAVPLAAFVGALVSMLLVLRIALSVNRRLDSRVLILAGVVVAAFFNSVILLLLTLADVESFRSAVFWMMGNLTGASWSSAGLLAAFLVPTVGVLLALSRPLNLLAVGEATAHHLGARVRLVKLIAYLATSLLVGAAVAVSGVIGFVGLIVPHGVRLLWGSDHRLLLPASFLAGATFLLLTDTVARTAVAPAELPTGVVTALLGVPVFMILLLRSGRP